MRAFLSIELPENLRNELSKLSKDLAKSGSDVKWVSEENIHLTLRFFGEISEEQRKEIESAIKNVSGSIYAFQASVSQIGAFPNIGNPRVIWVGIGQGAEKISDIARRLEDDFHSMGFPSEEKGFIPHITLGRLRTQKKTDALTTNLKNVDFNCREPFFVDSISLFQSTLTSSGPVYSRFSRWPLAKQP